MLPWQYLLEVYLVPIMFHQRRPGLCLPGTCYPAGGTKSRQESHDKAMSSEGTVGLFEMGCLLAVL